MEYKRPVQSSPKMKPRLIIHGGAGNIKPTNLTPERYKAVRNSLLGMIAKTHTYMFAPKASSTSGALPTALEVATYAVTLLENDPLFNAGKGAVFTRDGIQQLEASVMVSRGFAKRATGVLGLQHVKNPILLAKAMLEHGEEDLWGKKGQGHKDNIVERNIDTVQTESVGGAYSDPIRVDAPSAQGHTLLFGASAESLARKYGLELVPTQYFFTEQRWDEHIRSLEREKAGCRTQYLASWSACEYLPQGTTGAVALDGEGVVCCATSTGGLTNKLNGRIGDTPVPGAGYWAEEWEDTVSPASAVHSWSIWDRANQAVRRPGSALEFAGALRGLMADCLPTPFLYAPVPQHLGSSHLTTTRAFATSGTGNGDSFLRVNAARTAAAIARWQGVSSSKALTAVTGPDGELQKSAGDRWMVTGEGEGGMIGIESVVVRDADGSIVESRSDIIQDHNCPGMFRAWVDDEGKAVFQVWHDDAEVEARGFVGEGQRENVRECEKMAL
ncbi:Putative isoaspartyl peptidase/L-asparaginase [Cytospora mali]|uniref:Isoaspartyl peptidase/L-asparaginase n=1 Tax=Cytospora mali TaxID=578113 RepID=A0A194VZQ6_CYTMA|nr:Putative isoaspartyl peptidase/L-asparaginase [Valsa mali]